MMKFSRPYERSVLVYREGNGARILLRLGRTYENGECVPDEGSDIPENFVFLTYILSKDSEALLRDISARFEEYLDQDMGSYDGAVFDALRLQNRIEQEMSSGASSELLGGLELVYGKQVVEILFEATFGNDISLAKRSARLAKTGEAQHDFPALRIALAAFVAIVVLPLGVTLLVNPDAINLSDPEAPQEQGLIFDYAEAKTVSQNLGPATPEQSAAERIFEQARSIKQNFFLSLGDPNADLELMRPLPVPSGSMDQVPGQTAVADNPAAEKALSRPDGGSDTDQSQPFAEEAGRIGYPAEFAKFKLREFHTYSTGALLSGPELGTTGVYEISRDPNTIFEVDIADLDGIGEGLDTVAGQLCHALLAPDSQLAAAGLNIQLGRSDFLTTILDAGTCREGRYTLYPSFDLRIPQDPGQ